MPVDGWIPVLLVPIVAAIAMRAHAVARGGALAGLVVGTALAFGLGWAGFFMLMALVVIGTLTTVIGFAFYLRVVSAIFASDDDGDGIDPSMSEVFPWAQIPKAHTRMWKNQHAPGNMAVLVNAPCTGLRTLDDVIEAGQGAA